MAHAIFEVEKYGELPLWAQVLMASRLVRRAALWLPADVPARTAAVMLAGCDALDRCAEAGGGLNREREPLRIAGSFQPVVRAHAVASAMHFAIDSAMAAEAANDFGAADAACTASAGKAMACVAESPGLSPLQVRVFAAGDLDQLRFACGEARIGKYDALTSEVMQRLAPVYPPRDSERATSREEPRLER